jgi:hypothetical protein
MTTNTDPLCSPIKLEKVTPARSTFGDRSKVVRYSACYVLRSTDGTVAVTVEREGAVEYRNAADWKVSHLATGFVAYARTFEKASAKAASFVERHG